MVFTNQNLYGEENLFTLAAMDNLAGVICDQGDYRGAYSLNERVASIRRRRQGDENPYTLNSVYKMAGTLRLLGEITAAGKLHQ